MTLHATRRTVLLATGGATAALVAGCGDGDSGGSGQDQDAGAASASAGQVLARTSEIPVGGGKIFTAEKIVVTQPAKDDFKAFSAVCTHAGCTVATVADGTINCPCHKSEFKIADGSVVAGPAPSPLPAREITVEGGSITLA
ncbi:Rieske (2Fe-2S) protein [Streptomyces antibioticus]|uniref:Rieske (2Fe-2S) protein n=1 Tax=Streptomyces antibioticus TaxID=1890 RepID=UPI0036D7D88A